VFFSTSDIMVAAAPSGVAGDYDADGVVDASDYTVWRDHVGAAAGSLPNDVDGGVIGAKQYARWKANFGMERGAVGVSTVPEAGAFALVLACALASVSWRGWRWAL
jgi:hypothetical protein